MLLEQFVTANRAELIAACRTKVAKRTEPPAVTLAVDHGVPMFLDQLVEQLRVGLSDDRAIIDTAQEHGRDLMAQGYSVSQVVHGYGDVCQAITEMALDQAAPIGTDDFRILNRLLDDAIAGAVTQFAHERDRHIDNEAAGESRRVAELGHELRRLIRTSDVALDAIRSGRVGMAGSTGTVLQTAVRHASDVVDHLLDEVHARRPKHQVAG